MHGELAQVIALVAHGNAFFGAPADTPPPELLDSSSTFRWVRSLRVVSEEPDGEGRAQSMGVRVDETTAGWFRFLRSRGAERLWALELPSGSPLPPHVTAAFAGGVRFAIAGSLNGAWEVWRAEWGVPSLSPERTDADPNPWVVTYSGSMWPDPPRPLTLPLLPVKSELLSAVGEALALAREIGQWADVFSGALALLDAPDPLPPYHPDLLPPRGYSLTARQILAGAASAWVFGGMGSWNDLSIEERLVDRYRRVTRRLYRGTLTGALAGANAYGKDQEGAW